MLLLGTSPVLAITGGPFDNGDPGLMLSERGGFYAMTFSFKNGNGYGVFTPDSQLFGGLSANSGTSSSGAAFFDRGSLYTDNSFDATRSGNRSVFYYKGVTYVGACMGYPDLEARTITGTCNATSDSASFTQQTGTSNSGQQNSLSNSSVLVQNNTGFILNMGWEGKITRTSPTLRFNGKGEIAVLSPTGNASVVNLSYQAYQGLINAIISSTAQLRQANNAPVDFTSSQVAIDNALDSLAARVAAGGGVGPTYTDADIVKVKVSGSRRFF
ncbi:MAG: hypothetical protein KDK99_17425 [Verrucomicrobiales bacterium]|nr:hypothetical protein [Verrucomicrobiales bacterium]